MAMKKPMRIPGRCALALAIGLAFSAPGVYGAGLGRITVQSALGQPLRAEVEVTAVSREEAASLAVKLASIAAFRQANLEYNPALSGLRVSLGQRMIEFRNSFGFQLGQSGKGLNLRWIGLLV